MEVQITPAALESLEELAARRAAASAGAKLKLLAAVADKITQLTEQPRSCPPLGGRPGLHRCVLAAVNAVLVYRLAAQQLQVLAIYDARRNPGAWRF